MQEKHTKPWKRLNRIAAILAAFLALTIWVSPDLASADSRHPGRDGSHRFRHRGDHGHRGGRHHDGGHFRGRHGGRHHDRGHFRGHDGRGHFRLPHSIHHDNHHHFRPFFYGRAYFGPHRHYHDVYHFPYYTSYGLEYRPYYYCGGDLYLRGRVDLYLPGIGISVGF